MALSSLTASSASSLPQLAVLRHLLHCRGIKGKKYFGAKIIPARGVWMEIETDADGTIYCRIDRKRKFPVTSLLRILEPTRTRRSWISSRTIP